MKQLLTLDGTNRILSSFAFLLVAVLVAAGCSSSDGSEANSGTTIPPTASTLVSGGAIATTDTSDTTEASAEPEDTAETVPDSTETPVDALASAVEVIGSGMVLEAHDMQVERSGVQMRVERIAQRTDATFVRLAIVNGSDEAKEVPHHEVATLTLANGTAYEPVAAFPDQGIRLDSGESAVVVLVYPPTSGSFDLEVGVDGLATDQFSRLVGFSFDDLDPGTVVEGLQPDAPLVAVGTHPNGTQIELDGIRFTPDRIGVDIEVRNGSTINLWLFGADETFLEDDLGNRHRALVEPNGETFFELDPESSVTGILTFAGRMDPRATSFTIFVNDGGLLTNDQAKSPAFVLGPFDVGSAQTIEAPVDAEVNVTLDQVNGATGTLSGFTFDDRTIRAQVLIVNEGADEVNFNDGLTYVVDSEGITYKSQIEELPELVLGPGEGFEGEIVFSGKLQPDATSVRLTVNHGGELRHSFFFDAVDVSRSTSTATLSSFEVPDMSSFVIGDLDTSSLSAIVVAIAEFDGVEVDGGVLLTLPETILFDFGESTLRPEAQTSIALVADILDYYEGDKVLVVGHTDAIGDEAANVALSEDRANAVLDGLVAQGVSSDLLSIDGRGESEPVAANEQADGSDDPDGRQQNRRVEIFIETTRGIPEG